MLMIKFHNLLFTSLIVILLTSFGAFADDTNNCLQGNSALNSALQIAQKIDLPTYQSTGKFGYSGCLYDISYVQDTSQDWENTCYNFTLTRTSIESDSSEDLPDLTQYQCEVKPDCGVDNPNSLASFGKDKITGYPKGSSGYFEFAGCKYSAFGVTINSNQYESQCLNYMFYRLNDPVVPVINTMPDFTPFACIDKTCPTGKSLDSQGICQNNSCPLGQTLTDGVCVNNDGERYVYGSINDCKSYHKGVFFSSCSASGNYRSLDDFRQLSVDVGDSINFGYYLNSDGEDDYNQPICDSFSLGTANYKSSQSSSGPSHSGCGVRITATKMLHCKSGDIHNIHTVYSDAFSLCLKTCPNGDEIQEDIDCSTTVKTCPNGLEISINENCNTKICPNGDVIEFDLICGASGTGGTGDGTSSGNGNGDVVSSINNAANALGQKITNQTDSLGSKLDDLKDAFNQSGDSLVADILTQQIVTAQGSFDSTSDIQDIIDIQSDLTTRIDDIKTEMHTIIKPIAVSGGSFNQCYKIAFFMGDIKEVCLSEYQDEMLLISNIILFIFTVLAAIIIFGGLKNA